MKFPINCSDNRQAVQLLHGLYCRLQQYFYLHNIFVSVDLIINVDFPEDVGCSSFSILRFDIRDRRVLLLKPDPFSPFFQLDIPHAEAHKTLYRRNIYEIDCFYIYQYKQVLDFFVVLQ
jgi:hypothetical protein